MRMRSSEDTVGEGERSKPNRRKRKDLLTKENQKAKRRQAAGKDKRKRKTMRFSSGNVERSDICNTYCVRRQIAPIIRRSLKAKET